MDKCQEAPTLSVKIDKIEEKHRDFSQVVQESIKRIEAMLERFTTKLEKQIEEDRKRINSLGDSANVQTTNQALMGKSLESQDVRITKLEEGLNKQTQDQEVRISVMENKTNETHKEVESIAETVSNHGNRLAQVMAIAMTFSILLPVAFEFVLNQDSSAPQSEVGN